MLRALFAALLLLAIATTSPACKSISSPTGQKVISCVSDTVARKGILALPRVNSLLTNGGTSDCDGACKAELALLVADFGEDIVACMLRREAESYAVAAARDGRDEVSAAAAERARAILEQQGWTFAEDHARRPPMPGLGGLGGV